MNRLATGNAHRKGDSRDSGLKPLSGRGKERSGGYYLVYALAIAVVGIVVAFNVIRPITVLPRITTSPGYALTNQFGQTITSEDQRGQLTLYSFSYSDCVDTCPQSYEQINTLRSALSVSLPEDTQLDFVTISVDPGEDTPSRLNTIFNRLINDQETNNRIPWSLLTGDPERIRQIIGGGFQVYFAETGQAENGRIMFDPRYVLVDHLGIIRAEYWSAEPELSRIVRDVNLILREAENSQGISRIGYEAAHLFLCYPR